MTTNTNDAAEITHPEITHPEFTATDFVRSILYVKGDATVAINTPAILGAADSCKIGPPTFEAIGMLLALFEELTINGPESPSPRTILRKLKMVGLHIWGDDFYRAFNGVLLNCGIEKKRELLRDMTEPFRTAIYSLDDA